MDSQARTDGGREASPPSGFPGEQRSAARGCDRGSLALTPRKKTSAAEAQTRAGRPCHPVTVPGPGVASWGGRDSKCRGRRVKEGQAVSDVAASCCSADCSEPFSGGSVSKTHPYTRCQCLH